MNTAAWILVIFFVAHGSPVVVDKYSTHESCRTAGQKFVFDATNGGLANYRRASFSCIPSERYK